MAVNLYDSPAQAQFINTYVPIKFDKLYDIADRAQKSLDETNAAQDDFVANYSNLNTLSKPDKQRWARMVGDIESEIASHADPESLKDPMYQAKIKSMIRKFKGNPVVGDMMYTAEAGRNYAKAMDPRWGDYGIKKITEWDSAASGVFDKTPMQYIDRDSVVNPIVADLHPQWIRTKGMYDYKLS